MKDYAALKYAANTIRDEVEDGRNTAERVGGMLSRFVEAANTDIADLKNYSLFGSLLIEATDADKLDIANKCIKALYIKTKPAEGHRHVLKYLYYWDAGQAQITIADYNESTGVEYNIVNLQTIPTDTMATLYDGSNNEIGVCYVSSADYDGQIADQGETANRMPYLLGLCYKYNQGEILKQRFADNEQTAQEMQGEIDEMKVVVAPTLLLSNNTEPSDTAKCAAANDEVMALFLSVQPATGHRFVLSYLYLQTIDYKWFFTISDLNVNAGTSTAVVSEHRADDKAVSVIYDGGGNEIGKIYLDSTHYTNIANQGEGLARMPYLAPSCFDELAQYKLMTNALADTRATANNAKARVQTLEDEFFPPLFGSNNTEPSDTAKCAAANAEVMALYLSVRPATGHRFVLTSLYLQTSDYSWYFTIEDLNETAGTTTTLVNYLHAEDKALSPVIDTNGHEIGYILLNSDNYTFISNQGEGAARMPFLLDACFDYSTQSRLTRTITDERLTALEKKTTKKNITLWGDSITWGSASSANSKCYAAILQQLIAGAGYIHDVINCGVGGDNMPTIVGRIGGTALYLTKDITIPASASQSVVVDSVANYVQVGRYLKAACKPTEQIQLMMQGDLGRTHIDDEQRDARHSVNPMLINGVSCIWAWNAQTEGQTDAGTFTLRVETTQAAALVVKAGTPLYTHGARIKSDAVVLAMGTNAGFDTADEYVKMCDLAIEAANTKRFIVCSPYGGTALTQQGVSGLETLEAALLARYGARFFNWRKFMVEDALAIEGITPTSADTTAINEGKCPPSLLADEVHPNDYGHHAIGKRLFDMMQALGYFD